MAPYSLTGHLVFHLPLVVIPHPVVDTRLKHLEHLASRFDNKAGKIEAWLGGKDSLMSKDDDIEAANLAEVMVSSGGGGCGLRDCKDMVAGG